MLPSSANGGKLKASTQMVIGPSQDGPVQSSVRIEVDTDGIYSASIYVIAHLCHIMGKSEKSLNGTELRQTLTKFFTETLEYEEMD